MVVRLDENRYNENDLIQIKVPFSIPYAVNDKNYERCNGEFELNGIHYNYVKRILQNDTMYLYCVPNYQKTELNNTKAAYAKQLTDIPSGKNTEQSSVKKEGFSNEYNAGLTSYSFYIRTSQHLKPASFNNNNTFTGFAANLLQPPETV